MGTQPDLSTAYIVTRGNYFFGTKGPLFIHLKPGQNRGMTMTRFVYWTELRKVGSCHVANSLTGNSFKTNVHKWSVIKNVACTNIYFFSF